MKLTQTNSSSAAHTCPEIRGNTNFDPPNHLQPRDTNKLGHRAPRPAPGSSRRTARAARELDGSKNHAHDDAQLVEERTMDSRIMGKPGVDRAHLACHEQTAGALNGAMVVCGCVECAGGWLCVRRGCV